MFIILSIALRKIEEVVVYVNERKKIAENEKKLNQTRAEVEGLEVGLVLSRNFPRKS